MPGDDEWRFRLGDTGIPYGCDVVSLMGEFIPGIGDTGRIVLGAAVPEGGIAPAVSRFLLALSSSFFLPRFQNLRFPVFASSSGVSVDSDALFNPSPRRGVDDIREPASSQKSSPRLVCLSVILLKENEVVA
jgi:hypothetical protein